MGDKTGIEWTDATWNPVVGCSIISPGCTNCYAMKQANRILDGNPSSPHYAGTTKKVNGNAIWTGKIGLAPDHILTAPLRWKKPRKIFVNSMGDLFHENIPDVVIDTVFGVMALAQQHTFQVLTKRASRMRDYMTRIDVGGIHDAVLAISKGNKDMIEIAEEMPWPLSNVWLGVSVEDQIRADERIPFLLNISSRITTFLSCEPLLGQVDLTKVARAGTSSFNALEGFDYGNKKINWVIVGGESGPGARPMDLEWARSLRDQCIVNSTPFFMKQIDKKIAVPDDLMIRKFPT